MRTYSKVEHQVIIQERAFEDVFDDRYDVNEDFEDVLGDSLLNPLGESLFTNCSLGASLLNQSYPETSNSFRFEEDQVPCTSTPLKQKLPNDVYLFDIDPNCSPVSDNVCLEPLDDTIISMEEESVQCESNSDHSDSPNSSETAHNDIDPEQFHDIKAIPVRSSPSHRFKNTKLTAHKLVLRYTKTISILQCQKINCCVRKCARSITIKQMKDMRLRFWSQNWLERQQWILDKMKESQQFVFNTEIGRICQKTFIALFGINKNAYYSIRRRYLQGSSYTLDRKKYRKRSDKFINALIWLEEYATFRADRMPDSQTALLPYGTRRIRIYESTIKKMKRRHS
ncbi:unnamed protein product [Mytilus coruscus]|uniref:Uncharacterized protein n=1 Tax=Mytilus coruscus TaxID=42192 RepID=A0A6J8EJE5_MYTCO|nr:unnamed protein product [Mytilus coruscus]